jgi:hypothetical protein
VTEYPQFMQADDTLDDWGPIRIVMGSGVCFVTFQAGQDDSSW